jgi:hypothetical protein
MVDPIGLRLPGFLEILLEGDDVAARHHAWTGADWKVVPMLQLAPSPARSLTA